MLTYNSAFERELKKLIDREVEERKENLSTGLATIDFPTYKHQVGIITGLRVALGLCEDSNAICNRIERGQ